MEFFVDGDPHLLELGGVVGVEFFEAGFDGGAELSCWVRGTGVARRAGCGGARGIRAGCG